MVNSDIQSMMTQSGLTVAIHDSDDEKKIIIKVPSGDKENSIIIDDKSVAVADSNGNTIIMDDSGIQIKSGRNIRIEANTVTINGAEIKK